MRRVGVPLVLAFLTLSNPCGGSATSPATVWSFVLYDDGAFSAEQRAPHPGETDLAQAPASMATGIPRSPDANARCAWPIARATTSGLAVLQLWPDVQDETEYDDLRRWRGSVKMDECFLNEWAGLNRPLIMESAEINCGRAVHPQRCAEAVADAALLAFSFHTLRPLWELCGSERMCKLPDSYQTASIRYREVVRLTQGAPLRLEAVVQHQEREASVFAIHSGPTTPDLKLGSIIALACAHNLLHPGRAYEPDVLTEAAWLNLRHVSGAAYRHGVAVGGDLLKVPDSLRSVGVGGWRCESRAQMGGAPSGHRPTDR